MTGNAQDEGQGPVPVDWGRRALLEAVEAAAATDPEKAVRRLVSGLTELGHGIAEIATFSGDDTGHGLKYRGSHARLTLGFLAEACGELLDAATSCLESGRLYAAAALLRQVVELEHLLNDLKISGLPAEWWRSSESEPWRWKPAAVRKRLEASTAMTGEYHQHCSLGGHLTPTGARGLLGHPSAQVKSILVSEQLIHGRRIMRHLSVADTTW